MNQKEKYFLQLNEVLKSYEDYFGGRFEDVVIKENDKDTASYLNSLIESEQVEDREKGWSFSFWRKLLYTIGNAKASGERTIYYFDNEDYSEISWDYYRHFKRSDPTDYMKGRVGGIYGNKALEYLDDRVKDGLGYYGKRIISALEQPNRYKEVKDNREHEIVLFHGIDEEYFEAIINFDESVFPESTLIELAKDNARVAEKTLKMIKKYKKPLDKNKDYFNQYWTPRWSEEMNRDFITEAKKMAVYKEHI